MSFFTPNIMAAEGTQILPTPDRPGEHPHVPDDYRIPLSQLPLSMDAGVSRTLLPSGGDDSARMVDALTNFAPFVSPVVRLGVGVFQWNNSVPAFARSTPAKVMGSGPDKTTIRLSTGAPRAFDFGKIADYDVFDGIELSDFTVDCNNVTGAHHVVIGTYVNGAQIARISVNHLAARRLRTINVPSSPAAHRLNIWIAPVVGVTDNLCTLFFHTYEDLDFMGGGDMGVVVAGVTPGGNSQFGWIKVDGLYHDVLTPTGSSNLQIGSGALGVGPVSIDRVYGANSGDVGVEIDNCPDVTIGNVTFRDNVNSGVFFANIGYTVGSAALPSQVARIGKVTFNYQQVFTGVPISFGGSTWGSVEVGSINLFVGSNATQFPFAIHLLNCKSYDVGEVNYVALGSTGAGNFNRGPVNPVITSGVNTRLHIGHYSEQISGTWAAATWQGSFNLGDTAAAASLDLIVDRATIDNTLILLNYNGIYNDTTRRNNLVLTGAIRNLKVVGSPTPTNAPGGLFNFIIGANPPTPFGVERCDLSGFTFTPTNLYTVNNNASNPGGPFAGVISAHDNLYQSAKVPGPVGITGIVTGSAFGTGKAWNNDIRFVPGSGSGITSIDYSTNGGVSFANLLTQASGVMPAGPPLVLSNIDNATQLRVTFTGSQPTMVAVPRLP